MFKLFNALPNERLDLSEAAFRQGEIAWKEIEKFTDISRVSWGLISNEWFYQSIKHAKTQGIVIGASVAIASIIVGGVIILENEKRKANK